MEENVVEYFYNRILSWQVAACIPDQWGSESHTETCWEMLYEECVKEGKEALKLKDEVKLLDSLADTLVTLVPLMEIHYETWDATETAPSLMPIAKYIALCEPIIRNRRAQSLYYVFSCLMSAFDYSKYPMEKVLHEICNSNDSKFPSVEALGEMYGEDVDRALAAASEWIESNSEYKNVVGNVIKGRCIFRCDNGVGKILKPWSYVPPDIEGILDKFVREGTRHESI